ncbi:MAG: hypothetical protein HN855_08090 [Anaerolineae bacterium]|jgi:hypothetical protein|nr:hypothetical protein [Anaerolineae bacterium]MBT7325102.1 hypothetical protein [Anaerolineae bacterium]
MKKWQILVLLVGMLWVLLSCGVKFYRELEPDFAAIAYLETKGYRSVRITGNLPEGRGCNPQDAYRFSFDAIPSSGKKRVNDWVCGGGGGEWYQEK